MSAGFDEWLRQSADPEEAAELTARLVAVRSYPGEEAAVQRVVAAWLEEHGIAPEMQSTGAADRPNVLARLENGPGPTLLLNGHVDTVLPATGWSSDPLVPRRAGDRLYGLGACDMKSGVAAIMLATRALHRAPDRWTGTVIFSSVVDEEAYSIGARAMVDAGIRADACLVTESSWDHPELGAVGKVLVRVEVTGKAAHASWPHLGVNAAVEAGRFAAALDAVAVGQHPRMPGSQCLLSLLSGSAVYVITVPEKAELLINRHTVPGETAESVLAQYRAVADGLASPASFELSVAPPYYPSWETSPDDPLALLVARVYEMEAGRPPTWGYHGYGDANVFSSEAGIPTVQIGPRGDNFHAADEWVDVPSIAATVRVLLRAATEFLS